MEKDKKVIIFSLNPPTERGIDKILKSIAFNEKLSANRAKASAAYIKSRIKNPERIYGKGYGESRLKIDCPCEGTVKSSCTEEQHQQNRRTEFVIIKM